MKKTVTKQITNNSKNLALFDGPGKDELYQILQSERYDWHKPAKIFWQQIYNNHYVFLDDNFISHFPIDTFSRLWELTQVNYLASHSNKGLTLVKLSGNGSKPDFCFDADGYRYYLETVCASPGTRPELKITLAKVSGKARRTPITEYMESLCAEIREKAETKYYGGSDHGSGYKHHMEESSGLIIALSTSKIPFHNQANNFHADLRCVFGMSAPKIPLIPDIKSLYRMGDPYHDYQSSFNKITNKEDDDVPTPIKMDYFANDQFSHISAIILSHTGLVFFPDIDKFVNYCQWGNCRNDYTLIHNPFAKTRLPEGLLDVAREVTATVTDKGLIIHIKENIQR